MSPVCITAIKVIEKKKREGGRNKTDQSHWFRVVVVIEVADGQGKTLEELEGDWEGDGARLAHMAREYRRTAIYSEPGSLSLIWGWEETLGNLLYKEKYGAFVYDSCVIDCAASRGAIEDLSKLKGGYNPSHTTEEYYASYLLRLLDCLNAVID